MKKEKLTLIISIVAILISITSLLYVTLGNNNCDKTKDCINLKKPTDDWCCDGCECGDTIEMLKNIQTAWTLTEKNSNGEYVVNQHSFINFNGDGKGMYAYFNNDANAITIFEERGKFTINEKNEIILTPNNRKTTTTCTLGEEIDLLAVLNCDKGFGRFILQKSGKLELPSVITDTVSKTNSIIVKVYGQIGNAEEYGYKETKTIADTKEINKFMTIINTAKVWTGPVILPMPKYELELLDANKKSIAKITYSPNFDITINGKSYGLTDIDGNALDKIIK